MISCMDLLHTILEGEELMRKFGKMTIKSLRSGESKL